MRATTSAFATRPRGCAPTRPRPMVPHVPMVIPARLEITANPVRAYRERHLPALLDKHVMTGVVAPRHVGRTTTPAENRLVMAAAALERVSALRVRLVLPTTRVARRPAVQRTT